jgi:UDP-N-acetylmuramoyl-tripeptide--D-alanyl-D-alanine ligase
LLAFTEHTHARHFTPAEVEFAERLKISLSLAVENAQLFAQLQEKNEELEVQGEEIRAQNDELIEALPADGWAFFPSDNSICLDMYRRTQGNKLLFGLESGPEPLYMTAEHIELSAQGSSFELVDGEGNHVSCTTRLLGRHNILNIVGCAAVARRMGLTMAEISAGILRLEPVPHRLALVPSAPGITVIDDAFNSNPQGTRAALAVLSGFPGRKIIVTPGMVELGDREDEENEAFGRAMAPVVDAAILVARNGDAMARGLMAEGYPADQIIRVGNLAEATQMLASITQPGDVILFENDLPDHYEQ